MASEKAQSDVGPSAQDFLPSTMTGSEHRQWRLRLRNPWAWSMYTLLTTIAGLVALGLMVQSFLTKQLDVKGCEMSYMRPIYSKFDDFDTEHTRFASKYSLYLYREGGIDEDMTVRFIPQL